MSAVYYTSRFTPIRVCIEWVRNDGFERAEIDEWTSLTREQQAAVRLAWERLERGEMVGDIGPCIVAE